MFFVRDVRDRHYGHHCAQCKATVFKVTRRTILRFDHLYRVRLRVSVRVIGYEWSDVINSQRYE